MTKLLAARQIVTSMVTGILLWCVIGIGVSVLVSATLVLGYALFIVKDALAPAALSGAVQGLWLYLARNRWSGKKELVWDHFRSRTRSARLCARIRHDYGLFWLGT